MLALRLPSHRHRQEWRVRPWNRPLEGGDEDTRRATGASGRVVARRPAGGPDGSARRPAGDAVPHPEVSGAAGLSLLLPRPLPPARGARRNPLAGGGPRGGPAPAAGGALLPAPGTRT